MPQGWAWSFKAEPRGQNLGFDAGGGVEREEKEKFPVIVKAKVIGPLGAAAQKENQLTKRSTN